jgi:hypothetical protein
MLAFGAGPHKLPAGQSKPNSMVAPGRLAAGRGIGRGRADMRVVLGNVELLGFPQVAILRPVRGVCQGFRDAAAGLSRLSSFRPGDLHRLPFPERNVWPSPES